MQHAITGQTVLVPSPRCVVREQEHGHLIYNPQTDELHILAPTAFVAFQMCDGLHTAEEIHDTLATALGAGKLELDSPFYELMAGLVGRGLLEVHTSA